MPIATRFLRPGKVLLAAAFVLALAGCTRGLTIYNTSNHDVTFTQQVEGGERSYTLHPGAQMQMGPGGRVNLGDFAIAAE
jgi:hypothetical protein